MATKLIRPSTVDALVEAISSLAYAGELRSGDQLREHELAHRFEVGRHSVRSALQTLSLEGIAVHEQNRGVFVRGFTEAQISDLYLLRGAIESEAVRQIRLRGLPQGQVAGALETMASQSPSTELSELVLADLNVHRAIVLDSESESLLGAFDSMVKGLRLALAQTRYRYRDPKRLSRQHTKLVRDIWQSTPAAAIKAIHAHNDEAVKEVQEAYREEGENR